MEHLPPQGELLKICYAPRANAICRFGLIPPQAAMLAAPTSAIGPSSRGSAGVLAALGHAVPALRLLSGHWQGVGHGCWVSAAAPGADVEGNGKEHAWCQGVRSSARLSHSLQCLGLVRVPLLSPQPLGWLQRGGQAQAARKARWQHRGLVAGRVDLAVCWARESTAHRLLVAELLEDTCEHLSLPSRERDGKNPSGLLCVRRCRKGRVSHLGNHRTQPGAGESPYIIRPIPKGHCWGHVSMWGWLF